MKKTIITLLALAGVASAQSLENGLVAWWSFDNNSTSYYSSTGVTTTVNTGIDENHQHLTGGADGKGYISTNYITQEEVEEGGSTVVKDKNNFIDFYNGFNSFNLSATSFSLAFKVRGVTADYRSMFSLTLPGLNEQLQFQTANDAGGGSKTHLYGAEIVFDDAAVRTLLRKQDSTDWVNVVLTSDGTNLTLHINEYSQSVAYSATGNISNFQFASTWGDGQRKVVADFDDLGFWNRALTAGEVAVLTSGKVIPEPATATLSLLALASLAARRRRR